MAGELHKGEGLREIAGAAAARGSFSFDPDELQSLIRKWEELADSYRDSLAVSEVMALIDPAGDDFASKAHATAANTSGKSYLTYLDHNWKYCRDQAQLFKNALNDYLGVEDNNKSKIDKSGREV
jgi:hypothetical protein